MLATPRLAAGLFLSRKSVERHVSNILAKLGIGKRTELAGALAATLGSSAIIPQGSCAGLVVAWVWDGAPYRRWRARDHRVRIDVV